MNATRCSPNPSSGYGSSEEELFVNIITRKVSVDAASTEPSTPRSEISCNSSWPPTPSSDYPLLSNVEQAFNFLDDGLAFENEFDIDGLNLGQDPLVSDWDIFKELSPSMVVDYASIDYSVLENYIQEDFENENLDTRTVCLENNSQKEQNLLISLFKGQLSNCDVKFQKPATQNQTHSSQPPMPSSNKLATDISAENLPSRGKKRPDLSPLQQLTNLSRSGTSTDKLGLPADATTSSGKSSAGLTNSYKLQISSELIRQNQENANAIKAIELLTNGGLTSFPVQKPHLRTMNLVRKVVSTTDINGCSKMSNKTIEQEDKKFPVVDKEKPVKAKPGFRRPYSELSDHQYSSSAPAVFLPSKMSKLNRTHGVVNQMQPKSEMTILETFLVTDQPLQPNKGSDAMFERVGQRNCSRPVLKVKKERTGSVLEGLLTGKVVDSDMVEPYHYYSPARETKNARESAPVSLAGDVRLFGDHLLFDSNNLELGLMTDVSDDRTWTPSNSEDRVFSKELEEILQEHTQDSGLWMQQYIDLL